MKVVTNAGPLIYLGKVRRLDLLNLIFTEVLTTPQVYNEVVLVGKKRRFDDALEVENFTKKGNIKIKSPSSSWLRKVIKKCSQMGIILAEGEISAIALAIEINAMFLTNDLMAAKVAKSFNLEVHGVLYVLLESAKRKFITPNIAEKLMWEMINKNLWLKKNVIQRFLSELSKN